MSLSFLKLSILFRDGKPLGAVVDPVELAALASNGDAMPVGATFEELPGVTDGVEYGYAKRNGEWGPCPIWRQAEWEALQNDKDAAIASLAPAMKVELFPDHVPEAEKKQQRADERAVAEAKRLADLEAAEAAKP